MGFQNIVMLKASGDGHRGLIEGKASGKVKEGSGDVNYCRCDAGRGVSVSGKMKDAKNVPTSSILPFASFFTQETFNAIDRLVLCSGADVLP